MTNISEIKVGGPYILAARGNTPETLVKVIDVKGRWVKVRADFNGAEANVAAKDLTPATTKTAPRNGIISGEARARYTVTKLDGVVVVDCDDEVARILRGADIEDVIEAAMRVLNLKRADIEARYGHLNNGQISMNLRNRIRKAVKNNHDLLKLIK
jgi:hypothetical protein